MTKIKELIQVFKLDQEFWAEQWSERGVTAMLTTMIRARESRLVQRVNWLRLIKNATMQVNGCVTGMLRLLQGPKQSSTTGMAALKGLRLVF